VLLVDSLDEFVEDGGAFGLAVFLGVVALALARHSHYQRRLTTELDP
jgi:hypothetical protein